MRPVNFLKRILRLLIVTGSVGGFFGGWAFLAHTEQPADAQQAPVPAAQPAPVYVTPTPLPPLNLPALPAIGTQQPLKVEPLPTLPPLPTPPPPAVRQPRLRTRGS